MMLAKLQHLLAYHHLQKKVKNKNFMTFFNHKIQKHNFITRLIKTWIKVSKHIAVWLWIKASRLSLSQNLGRGQKDNPWLHTERKGQYIDHKILKILKELLKEDMDMLKISAMAVTFWTCLSTCSTLELARPNSKNVQNPSLKFRNKIMKKDGKTDMTRHLLWVAQVT